MLPKVGVKEDLRKTSSFYYGRIFIESKITLT